MSTATPQQVLQSIVTGINSGDLDSLLPLYEREAAFATQPGSLAPGTSGIRDALSGFISMQGTLDLDVTRVLEVDDLEDRSEEHTSELQSQSNLVCRLPLEKKKLCTAGASTRYTT